MANVNASLVGMMIRQMNCVCNVILLGFIVFKIRNIFSSQVDYDSCNGDSDN